MPDTPRRIYRPREPWTMPSWAQGLIWYFLITLFVTLFPIKIGSSTAAGDQLEWRWTLDFE